MTMLTERTARILELVIGEYVQTAVPVGSKSIARKYRLGISPATIRNEMAKLEEEGYITHPHTSAGRIPSDKGYRYYVESLMEEEELPREVRETVRHQFHQARREQEEWVHLAAAILAALVRNAAIVTLPRSAQSRLKHLELIGVRDFVALVVVVLEQAVVRQQVITLPEPLSQEELTAMATRLNGVFGDLTAAEMAERSGTLTAVEELVMAGVREMMEATDRGGYGDMYLEGVRHMLSQPEFARSDKMLDILELLDEHTLPRLIPFRALASEGVTIIIGRENWPDLPAGQASAIGQCSMVVAGYGSPVWGAGAMAVVGPTRMHYPRTISTVRYMAEVMGELMAS